MCSASRAVALGVALALALTLAPPWRAAHAVSSRIMWSGALTDNSVSLRVQTLAAGQFLVVSTSRSLTDGVSVVEVPEAGVAAVDVTGLAPGTTYYYGVPGYDNTDESLTGPGKFTTFAAAAGTAISYRVAFASCAWTGAEGVVFDQIVETNPAFFIHMGDLHYENIETDNVEVRDESYELVFSSDSQRKMFAAMPVVYMWDDHDFGPNNADGNFVGRDVALRAYREFVPHYPLVNDAEQTDPVYQAFTVGRVRYIVTDLRSDSRLPESSNSTLGWQQRAWLFEELRNYAAYGMVVWVTTKPWVGGMDDGDTELDGDRWGYYAAEREMIATYMRDVGVDNLVALAGDAHLIGIDSGANTDYAIGGGAGFPLFHAAPMSQYGSTKDTGPFDQGCFGYKWYNLGQFGTMDVVDDGSGPLCIQWRAHREGFDEPVIEYQECAPFVKTGTHGGDGCSIPTFPPWLTVSILLVFTTALLFPVMWCVRKRRLRLAAQDALAAGKVGAFEVEMHGGAIAEDGVSPAHVRGPGGGPGAQGPGGGRGRGRGAGPGGSNAVRRPGGRGGGVAGASSQVANPLNRGTSRGSPKRV